MTEDIEFCDRGQLKVINIMDNQTTIESYKVISTLLEINTKVAIYFDDPVALFEQQTKLEINLASLTSPHVGSKVEPINVPAQNKDELAHGSVNLTDLEHPQTTSMNLGGLEDPTSIKFSDQLDSEEERLN